MATQAKSTKSVSSIEETPPLQNNSEVESRIKALEEKANEKGGGDSDRIAALEAKVEDLIVRLQRKMSF